MIRILFMLVLSAQICVAQEEDKRPTIEPFYSVATGSALQGFIGNTATITDFDAIFVTVRSLLPEDRAGRALPSKLMHFYAEVFVRKSLEPKSISLNTLPMQMGSMISLNGQNYQYYKTPYHLLKGSGPLKGPEWVVDWRGTDNDYGNEEQNSLSFVFPFLYRQPDQKIKATKVNMPENMRQYYQIDVSGNQEIKARLENDVLSRFPYVKPVGGYFALGGYRYTGWSVLTKMASPEYGDFVYIVPSGVTLLTAELSKQEKCYSVFRTYVNYVQEVKLGEGRRQRWLFVNVSEHVVPVELDYSPGSYFVESPNGG